MDIEKLPQRKSPRLKGFDYHSECAYFVTICTKGRKCLLSRIVGTGEDTCPYNKGFVSIRICVNVQAVLY